MKRQRPQNTQYISEEPSPFARHQDLMESNSDRRIQEQKNISQKEKRPEIDGGVERDPGQVVPRLTGNLSYSIAC